MIPEEQSVADTAVLAFERLTSTTSVEPATTRLDPKLPLDRWATVEQVRRRGLEKVGHALSSLCRSKMRKETNAELLLKRP